MHSMKTLEATSGERASCASARCPADELVCQWLVRLLLPALVACCGLVVFWTCFDNVYGADFLSILGGALIALVSLPISIWAWESWSR